MLQSCPARMNVKKYKLKMVQVIKQKRYIMFVK